MLSERGRFKLGQIDASFSRITPLKYGLCEMCGLDIAWSVSMRCVLPAFVANASRNRRVSEGSAPLPDGLLLRLSSR